MSANSSFDISQIAGNASDQIKAVLGDLANGPISRRPEGVNTPIFGESIQKRLKVTEISINKNREEPSRTEGRMVIEVDVGEDMLNGGGFIHGGCSAFLVDLTSTLCLMSLGMATKGKVIPGVSQTLNLVYHSPAAMGEKLRLVNTTLTVGARALSCRTEIWNATHHRLMVSATHVKMAPSPPKASL